MAHWTQSFSPADLLLTAEVMFLQDLYDLASGDASNVSIGGTWVKDATPTGTVNGVTTVFTLPVSASQVVVYADGIRVKGGGVTYTHATTTITFVSGLQPYSSISVDYLPS